MSDDLDKALDARIERVLRRLLAEQKPANEPEAEYLSTREAAAFARVSVYTIRRWVRQGELTRHEAGSRVLVKRDELERLLACDVTPIEVNLSPRERARRQFG